MKRYQRSSRGFLIGLVMTLVFIPAILVACEDFSDLLLVENQTSQLLVIYLDGVLYEEQLAPGEEIGIPTFRLFTANVTATNAQGEVLFSQELTLHDPDYTGSDGPQTIRVVIPPLTSSDNTTGNVTPG